MSLRLLLLKVFCECCGLGQEVISQLLCTVLPVELARDMQAARNLDTDSEGISINSLIAFYLSMNGYSPFSHCHLLENGTVFSE